MKKKIHIHLKKHIDLQSEVVYDDKHNYKKSLHILEDGTSGM